MGLIADAICETLWPTRCAPFAMLRAPFCAHVAPLGSIISIFGAHAHGAEPPSAFCSATIALPRKQRRAHAPLHKRFGTQDTGVLIKTYKDKGEQRLSETLAAILANALPPSWLRWANGVTYVSATKAARRRRGFDHMELLARSLAGQCGLSCIRALNPPTARDQRI